MTENIVQVLHVRYADDGCSTEVYLNGMKVQAHVEDVDPGRGYSQREWNRRVKEATSEAIDFPTDFTRDVAQALADNADNQYLTEDSADDEEDEFEKEQGVCRDCKELIEPFDAADPEGPWVDSDGVRECQVTFRDHHLAEPTHRTYYVSQDSPGGSWSVYTELFTSNDSESPPIDGSQSKVESGFPTEELADAFANALRQEKTL